MATKLYERIYNAIIWQLGLDKLGVKIRINSQSHYTIRYLAKQHKQNK